MCHQIQIELVVPINAELSIDEILPMTRPGSMPIHLGSNFAAGADFEHCCLVCEGLQSYSPSAEAAIEFIAHCEFAIQTKQITKA